MEDIASTEGQESHIPANTTVPGEKTHVQGEGNELKEVSDSNNHSVSGGKAANEALSEDDTAKAVGPSGETESEVSGWLQKRRKGVLGMSCKWERRWCCLRGTDLSYGNNEQVGVHVLYLEATEHLVDWFTLALLVARMKPFSHHIFQATPKTIPLAGAEITETDIDTKTFAFGIKPKDSKRTFYLHAENEEEQQKWMHAICMAKLNKSGEAGACSVQ